MLFTSILPLQGYAAKSESINLQEDNVTENKETGNPPQLDISLNSSKEALEVNENSFEDFSYVLTVSLQNESQEVSDYAKEVFFDFKLTTPQSVSLPEETYIYDSENACIFAGEKPFMSFTGLPENAEVFAALKDGNTLCFTVKLIDNEDAVIRQQSALTFEIHFSSSSYLSFDADNIQKDDCVKLNLTASAALASSQTISAQAESVMPVIIKTPATQPEQQNDDEKDSEKAQENNQVQTNNTLERTSQFTVTENDQIIIDSYMQAYNQNIFLVDNNNEANLRPEAQSFYPKLMFSIDGGNFVELTAENAALIGLTGMPQVNIDENAGIGLYVLTIPGNTLPESFTKIDMYSDQTTHTVEWKILPREINGYDLTDVTEENLPQNPSVTRTGWYYTLLADFVFEINLRWGTLGSAPGIADAILENFAFYWHTSGGIQGSSVLFDMQDQFELAPGTGGDNPTNGIITIHNTWKYNLDGSQITYYIKEIPSSNGIVTSNLESGDFFKPSYDNTSAPNFSSVTDRVHNNGKLIFTLTGTEEYNSYKVWLDDDNEQNRPEGEFQLWRYRQGQSYTTAAPVRDANGDIITLSLDTKGSQTINFDTLEKYDAEGYRYIYVVREYLESSNVSYEQIFGEVEEDGTVNDRVDKNGVITDTNNPQDRPSGNTFLYNGATLSNRITADQNVSVTKQWAAAAFQAEFEDVSIELVLQSRLAGSDDEWVNTGVVATMDNFFAENLTSTVSRSASKYDALGRELEYRWVESAVYQGNSENLLAPDEDGGTFTLNQNGRNIVYRSDSVIQTDGSTYVLNSIANTIDYNVIKIWHDAQGQPTAAPNGAEVTFSIYRTINAEELETPVASFIMDGTTDAEKTLVNSSLGIYAQETSPWEVTVTPLAEYDEQGRQYEYILIEAHNNEAYLPVYETVKDDEGNYETTIINSPGEGNMIMVRKEWTDDSDIMHRQEVTIGVYLRSTNEKIAETKLGNDVWYDFVDIGSYEAQEVYILETYVGETQIPLTTYSLYQSEEPNYSDPEAPDEYQGLDDESYTYIQYRTIHHRYEAVYSHETVDDMTTYVVNNRRLGSINLTVTKNWVDGSGEIRTLIQEETERIRREEGIGLNWVIRLNFASESVPDYYEISRSGLENADSVIIGNPDNEVPIMDSSGNYMSSDRIIDMNQASSVYEFFNLPKYDRNGSSVRYSVEELWLNDNGEIVTMNEIRTNYPDLYTLISEYNVQYEQTDYIVGDHYSSDEEIFVVTNKLSATKSVEWFKDWKDEYVYLNNQRPDIYLNIYQTVHISDTETETRLYYANYKWDNAENSGLHNINNWRVELTNLPKYDSLGYEIIYYATEHTVVDKKTFDYQDVMYYFNSNDSGLLYLGSEYAINQGNEIYVKDIQHLEGSQNPHYALIEDGTFSNIIKQTVSIQGQKLWSSLPEGYPAVDLPAVTFTVDRHSPDGTVEYNVAELTVKDWASIYINGSYIFRIEYLGANTMTVNSDGTVSVTGPTGTDADVKLPKYGDRGELYTYTITEKGIIWPNTAAATDWTDVFKDPIINTYLVENAYDSVHAAVAVKKYLQLPLDENSQPLAFPQVRMELTRTYTLANGQQSQPETVSYMSWSSAEVRQAYDEQKNTTVEHTFIFENLDIYAPNGSKYNYSVSEIKTYLNDYDTWAVAYELMPEGVEGAKIDENQRDSISGLVLTPDENGSTAENVGVSASFINARQTDLSTVELQGLKIWDDFDNTFGLRHENIELRLFRYANSQPGQNNPIAQEEISADEFTVQWIKSDGEWSYTIRGNAEDELERYAPNGMPWKYRIREVLPDDSHYEAHPSHTVGEKTQADNLITMNDLTNTIMLSVPYSKNWVDSQGNIITNDYLNQELSVTFSLQVSEYKNGQIGNWHADPDEYFAQKLSADIYNKIIQGYEFKHTKTGRINDMSVWGVDFSFDNLPSVIVDKNTGEIIDLVYRVVEETVSYGDVVQTVKVIDSSDNRTYTYEFSSGIFSPAYWANGRTQPWTESQTSNNNSSTKDLYNRMETVNLNVSKIWEEDSGNAYGTRPDTQRTGYDWQVSFVIQKSTDAVTWQNVKTFDENAYGVDLIITLYGKNEEDSVSAEVTGLPKSDEQGNIYFYRIKELHSDYTLQDGNVKQEDIAEADDTFHYTYSVSYPASDTALNTMNTTKVFAEKQWNPSSEQAEVILRLEYKDLNGKWISLANVHLDGSIDFNPQKPYYEYKSWKAVWDNLPAAMPGSDLTENGKTQYRVVEINGAGYIVESVKTDVINGYPLSIYTNVDKVSFDVEKIWYGVTDAEKKEITAELYRTTGSIDEGEAEKVTDSNGDPVRITLNKSNEWKASFTNLAKYDASGNLYTYYAKEVSIGGTDISLDDYYIYYENMPQDYKTIIINIGKTNIQGTKTWIDNSNAYGVRPDSVELVLWRSIDGQNEEIINVQPEWSNTSGDTWTYVYRDLPKANESGDIYEYRVEEVIPQGYELSQNKYDLTNSLITSMDIVVTKVWFDYENQDGLRPEYIRIALYANGVKLHNAILSSDNSESENPDEWVCTFKDLPIYSDDGSKIVYTVKEENAVDGYEAEYDGYNIVNIIKNGLSVTKTVEGAAAQTDREFNFVIKLDDNSINGVYGDIEFINGTASFTLKHGETKQAVGLPSGISYTVTEKEADKEGYSTDAQNATGTIPAGETVSVTFVNHRDSIPDTGDNNNVIILIGALVVSAVCIIIVLILKKGKKS